MTLVILLVASFSFRRRSPTIVTFYMHTGGVRESRRVPIPLSRITAIYEGLEEIRDVALCPRNALR